MSGHDDRPRPQYGEYASPEEQAARTGGPITPPVPVPVPVPVRVAAPAGPQAPVRRASLADRIATFALLGYGLFSTISQMFQALDYPAFADAILSMLGATATLEDPAGAQVWGTVAAMVVAVCWTATAALCIARLRRGRSAWWIALVAGAVVQLVVAILLVIPLYADPAVLSALTALV